MGRERGRASLCHPLGRPMADKGQDQISQILGAGSPLVPPSPHPHSTGWALLCFPDKVQGLLFSSVTTGKGEGSAPLPVGCSRRKGGGHLSLVPTAKLQVSDVVPAVPLSCPQGCLTHAPVYRVNSTEVMKKVTRISWETFQLGRRSSKHLSPELEKNVPCPGI